MRLSSATSVSTYAFPGLAVVLLVATTADSVHAQHRAFLWNPPPPGGAIEEVLETEEGPLFVELKPHTIRAAHHRRFDEDGTKSTWVSSEAPCTYRGQLHDGSGGRLDGALVAASRLESGMRGMVFATDGTFLELRPLTRSHYELIPVADIPAPPFGIGCGSEVDGGWAPEDPVGPQQAITGTRVVDLAVEIDFAYVQWAGSAGAAQADAEAVLNAVSAVYEQTFDVTFQVVATIVQTAGSAPYTTNDDSLFMGQIMNKWQTQHSDIQRDLVHVISGKSFPSGVAGRAWLGGLCSGNLGYGWSAATGLLFFNWRWAVTAHELGHNFGANHCNGQPDCGVMCAGLITCADFTQFGVSEQQEIQAHLQSVSCLEVIPDPIVPPFVDSFDKKKTSAQYWSAKSKTDKGGVGEPSAKRAVRLDASASALILATNTFDLSGMANQWVSFRAQPRGVEVGEALVLERLTSNGTWEEVGKVDATEVGRDTFDPHAFALPATAHVAELKLRLRALVNQFQDRWFVDDFRVASKSEVVGDQPLLGDGLGSFLSFVDKETQATVTSQATLGNRGDPTAPLSFSTSVSSVTPWLQLLTASGSVTSAESSAPLDYAVDTTALAPGIHRASIDLQSGVSPGDSLSLPVGVVVAEGAIFAPGDSLTAVVSGVPGDQHVAYFTAVKGMKLVVSLPSGDAGKADEGLPVDAIVAILDSGDEEVAAISIAKITKKGWATKLKASGLFSIWVTSGEDSGMLDLSTSRKLPKKALVFDGALKPDTFDGVVQRSVTLEAGGRLSVTAAPSQAIPSAWVIDVIDPAGVPLDVRAWRQRLLGDGMTLDRYPITEPGVYQVVISGLAGKPKVALTIDPDPPTSASGTVEMSIRASSK